MTVNAKLSRRLSKLVKGRDGECYSNSVRAIIAGFAKGTRDLCYVEGMAMTSYGLVTEHGWLEYRGKVVEVTPTWLKGRGETRYFPARRWRRWEVLRFIGRNSDGWLPISASQTNGLWIDMSHPGWKEAHRAAYTAIMGEEAYARLFYAPHEREERVA